VHLRSHRRKACCTDLSDVLREEFGSCVPQDCPELFATTVTVQSGYKETYDDLGISERKEIHLSLRPRAWAADILDEMQKVGCLRGQGRVAGSLWWQLYCAIYESQLHNGVWLCGGLL
jgi:hypothetical protein